MDFDALVGNRPCVAHWKLASAHVATLSAHSTLLVFPEVAIDTVDFEILVVICYMKLTGCMEMTRCSSLSLWA